MTHCCKDWVNSLVEEVGEVVSGGTPSTKVAHYWSGDINWIRPADLSGYFLKHISHGAKMITQDGLDHSSARLVPEGTILFSSRAPVGYVAIANNELCTNQGFKNLVPCAGLDSDFLYYYFKSIKGLANSRATGTTFKELSGRAFRALPVVVPPLVEQRAIVGKIEALFSGLDKGVEQLQAAGQQLKRYRQSVLKAAFEGKLTADWRAKQQAAGTLPSADDLLSQIKAERATRYQQQLADYQQAVTEWEAAGGKTSTQKKPRKPAKPKDLPSLSAEELADLPGLPDGWVWAKLNDLADCVRNGLSKKPKSSPPGCPILRINAVRPMSVDLSETRYYDQPNEDTDGYLIRNGDLLFTRYNGSIHLLGVCGMVRGCQQEILHPDKLIRVCLTAPTVVSAFVELAANSGSSRRFVVSRARTTAGQTGVSGGDIRGIPIPLAPLDEQAQIVQEAESRFSVLDELEKAVESGLQQAEALRQSILKKAFEGRLLSEAELSTVQADPDYEPADKLLERIRTEREQAEAKKPKRTNRRAQRTDSTSEA